MEASAPGLQPVNGTLPASPAYIAAAKAVAQLTLPALFVACVQRTQEDCCKKAVGTGKVQGCHLQAAAARAAQACTVCSCAVITHCQAHTAGPVQAGKGEGLCVCVHTAAVITTTLMHSNATPPKCRS